MSKEVIRIEAGFLPSCTYIRQCDQNDFTVGHYWWFRKEGYVTLFKGSGLDVSMSHTQARLQIMYACIDILNKQSIITDEEAGLAIIRLDTLC